MIRNRSVIDRIIMLCCNFSFKRVTKCYMNLEEVAAASSNLELSMGQDIMFEGSPENERVWEYIYTKKMNLDKK